MEVIRTDRTYATRANAIKALKKALGEICLNLDDVRWLVAVNNDGRHAPAVLHSNRWQLNALPGLGITVLS